MCRTRATAANFDSFSDIVIEWSFPRDFLQYCLLARLQTRADCTNGNSASDALGRNKHESNFKTDSNISFRQVDLQTLFFFLASVPYIYII